MIKRKKSRIRILGFSIVYLGIMLLLMGMTSQDNELTNGTSETIYANPVYGFSFDYDGYTTDTTMEKIKTVFYDDTSVIEIFYDNFKGTIHSQSSYINYSDKHIKDNNPFLKVNEPIYIHYNDYSTKVMQWSRKNLKHVSDDLNHYTSITIKLGSYEIYTIYARSSSPLDYNQLLERFKIIDTNHQASLPPIFLHNNIEKPSMDEETYAFYEEAFLNSKQMDWGIFEPSTIHEKDKLSKMESYLEIDFKYLLEYYSIKSPLSLEHLENIASAGKTLEFTYQTTAFGAPEKNAIYRLLDGEYDDVLVELFSTLAASKSPILFRLNNEMNGDWCLYNAFYFSKDTSLYRDLWRHFYNIAQEQGATNLIWVWNPNWGDFPSFKWNHYLNYYPGEEYVDIVGVTSYNTGTYYKSEGWKEFQSMYEPLMAEYTNTFDYPFMVTEFSCSDFGGDKVQWMETMFEQIKEYNFAAAIWFNGVDYDSKGNPARIYTIDHDPKYMDAFKENFNK